MKTSRPVLARNLANTLANTLAGIVLIGSAGLAWSQTTGDPVAPTTTTTQPATAATPTSKLVSSFSSFAGSEENAASLVNGLRTGSAITLTSAGTGTGTGGTGGTTGGETTTFTSPTKPMGYGNIRIAMSLAEAQLASQGVTNPTPTQLQGALMGSTTGTGADATTTQGILQMRASGMGWGQIANSMGFKLGPVMSGKQTFTEATATTAAGTATGSTTTRGKSGVTTAGGGSAGKSGVTTAGGGSGGKGGVTTAGGGSAGKGGVTTAGGGSAGKSGVTTAGGGSGNAYGHAKSSVVTAAGGVGGGGAAVASGLGHGNAGGASAGVVSASGGGAGGGGQGGGHGKGGGKP